MILDKLEISPAEFEAGTGWALKPEGACKGDMCVPLRAPASERVDVAAVAESLGMPLLAAPEHGVWALGPESLGGHALATADAPDIELEDLEGNAFSLSQLRGQKILIYAWAPY